MVQAGKGKSRGGKAVARKEIRREAEEIAVVAEENIVQKIMKFTGVGIVATLIEYLTYQFGVNVIFGGNLTLSAVLSGVVATFAAYLMHSKITWKTRDPGKYGVVLFFIWNAIAVFAIRPPLTWVFEQLDGLYQFAYMLTSWVFSYEFVRSTGVYVLMSVITMILNYLVYEKVVFTKKKGVGGEKVDVKGVGEAGEEE